MVQRALVEGCLHFSKTDGELWTPELVAHQLKFATREEQDFASAIATAIRRYERQGALETGKDAKTQALRRRLHEDVARMRN